MNDMKNGTKIKYFPRSIKIVIRKWLTRQQLQKRFIAHYRQENFSADFKDPIVLSSNFACSVIKVYNGIIQFSGGSIFVLFVSHEFDYTIYMMFQCIETIPTKLHAKIALHEFKSFHGFTYVCVDHAGCMRRVHVLGKIKTIGQHCNVSQIITYLLTVCSLSQA